MKKIPRWLWILIGLAVLVAVLKFVVFRPSPIPVEAVAVETGSVEEIVTNTRAGTVKVRQRADISPQIGGLVAELPFRKGDRVEEGALLLRLDDSLQRAELRLARENVKTAEARAEEACLASTLAEKEWRRGIALNEDGIVSEQDLDVLESSHKRAEAACRAARTTLTQAGAQVEVVEAQLALTEVRAPFSGIIAECSTELGEWITPSPPGLPIPPVMDILDESSLYISAPIDEVDAERVQVGQEARLTVDSRRGKEFPGRVAGVAPYVLDALEQNRTVEIEAEFDDPDLVRTVFPGTSADVEVILSKTDDVLRVPSGAVAEGGKVLLVESGKLVERRIITGARNWQWVEVSEGLKEGDLVVTSRDSTDVKPGARVEIREPR